MNVFEIILFGFCILSLIFSAYLISKRTTEYVIFGIILFFFGYDLFIMELYWTRLSPYLLIQFRFTYLISFSVYGFLIYFYVRKIVEGKDIKWRDSIHFIPLIITIFCYGSYFFLKPSTKIKVNSEGNLIDYIYYFQHFDAVLIAIMIAYCVFVFLKYRNSFNDDKQQRIWLLLMFGMFSIFVLTIAVYNILLYQGIMAIEIDYLAATFSALSIGIGAYYTIRYPEIINGKRIEETIPFVKYQRSGLTDEFALEMKIELEKLMKQQKPYLMSDLRLEKLAKMLNVSRNQASQIINDQLDSNFFDYINSYRIQEAERLMIKNQKLTIEDILYQSGFNNKVSFYKAFRKIHHTTPTEFAKKNRKPVESY